jgi:ABC-type spermidine/putrescine transport system permease subunit II
LKLLSTYSYHCCHFKINAGMVLSILKKIALYFAEKRFCCSAIQENADLSAFKEKPTLSVAVGISLILFSYVIGLPAVIALGVIAAWLEKPLIGIIGGPLIYGISTLIFIIGIKLAGKKYVVVLFRWLTCLVLTKILGDELIQTISKSPRPESEKKYPGIK